MIGKLMTSDESKALKLLKRVSWLGSAVDRGTVMGSDWSGVQINWDTGKSNFYHHNDMGNVRLA
jgi:hypothetical protein